MRRGSQRGGASGAHQIRYPAWDGLDRRRVAELRAQPADRHLDDVRERVGVLVPDAGEQLLGGDGRAVGGEQHLEHAELLRAQRQQAAAAARDPLRRVEADVALREHRRQRRLRAAGERADPRDELGERERLRQVVVGAEAEPVDAVLDRARGGQHQHARPAPAADERAADVVAVQPGRSRSSTITS